MLLAYLDESSDRATYCVTALMIHDRDAIPLAAALDKIVLDACGKYNLASANAELHGYELAWGRGEWSSLRGNVAASAEVYRLAVEAIASFDVSIACRGVDLDGLALRYGNQLDPHGVALTFALERIEWKAVMLGTVAMVVADEVGAKQGIYRQNFREYQQYGTWGWRSTKLEHLIDTIQFAPSASSRLLQAADLVSYARYEKDKPNAHPTAHAFYEQLWTMLIPKVYEDSLWTPIPITFK